MCKFCILFLKYRQLIVFPSYEKTTITEKEDNNEVILYEIADGQSLNVYLEDETIWLTQSQMAELFDCSIDNIGLHLRNIYNEQELEEISTTEFFSVVRQEGKRDVKRIIHNFALKNVT